MAVLLRRGTTPTFCVTSTVYAEETGLPAENAATALKLLVPNPHSTPLHMVQHAADWVASFPRNKNSPHPLLKLFHTPLHLPPLLPLPPHFRAEE